MHVMLHIDGGSRGNPGPAGAGVVIRCVDTGKFLHEHGYFLGRATNNAAEYAGLIRGLEAAQKLGATHVAVHSDSQLMVRQLLGQYRVLWQSYLTSPDESMKLQLMETMEQIRDHAGLTAEEWEEFTSSLSGFDEWWLRVRGEFLDRLDEMMEDEQS